MKSFRLEPGANRNLDDIMDFSVARWGEAQAEAYVEAMFEEFAAIADRRVIWRGIPPELGMDGFVRRWRSHILYWKEISDGEIAIVAILHQRMHQSARLRDMLDGEP